MIYDTDQFDRFVSSTVELKQHEAAYFAWAARVKYLTLEQRAQVGKLPDMYGRVLYRQGESLESLRRRLLARGDEMRVPQDALVLYMRVNPVDLTKGALSFMADVNARMATAGPCAETVLAYLNRADRHLKSHVYKTRSRRVWADFDFDTAHQDLVARFLQVVDKHAADYRVVTTRGGWHVLVRTGPVLRDLEALVPKLHAEAAQEGGEVIRTTSEMVPVPGTRQGDAFVRWTG